MKLIAVPEIAEKYNADPSQLNKAIKNAKIKTHLVIRGETGKSCHAISDADMKTLLKLVPSLTAKEAGKDEVPLSQVANEIAEVRGNNPDISGLLKKCASRKIKLVERKVNGRLVKCLNKKDYDALMSEVSLKKVV
jgi:hypothetical protein